MENMGGSLHDDLRTGLGHYVCSPVPTYQAIEY